MDLKVVFVARSAGQSQLWLRSLDSPSARPLAGTERGSRPFWSPDSRSIGFFADTRLKRIDIDGGSVQTLASGIPVALGGAWNGDGTIIFGEQSRRADFPRLRRGWRADGRRPESSRRNNGVIPSRSSSPTAGTSSSSSTGSPEARGVYVGQLDGLDAKRLFDADGPAVYAATGHLLFVREGKLLAQGFDPDRLELRGDAVPIADHVTAGTSVVRIGRRAYRLSNALQPTAASGSSCGSIGRAGKPTRWSMPIRRRSVRHCRTTAGASPCTGSRTATWTSGRTKRAVARGTGSRLTPATTSIPSGRQTAPASCPAQSGRPTSWISIAGNSAPRRQRGTPARDARSRSFQWTGRADGRFCSTTTLIAEAGPGPVGAAAGRRAARPSRWSRRNSTKVWGSFLQTASGSRTSQTRRVALEIYLRPFPGPGDDVRVSIDGGAQVRWNPNGKELFYIAADDRLMAVPIRFLARRHHGRTRDAAAVVRHELGQPGGPVNRQQYVVAPDGQSFVMNSAVGEGNASPITVILNWNPQPGGTARSAR